MEISYTEGPMNLNWKSIMSTVEGDDRFYMDTEEDEVTPKEAGWEFLRMFGKDDEGSEVVEEQDSGYSEHSDEESVSFLCVFDQYELTVYWCYVNFSPLLQEEEEEEEEEEAFDSEEESDYDGDEDLEEEGMDWDDMEREAAADDRRRKRDDDAEESRPKRKRGRR
jgi:nucleosome binding factor SPN SPT16 subunit